MIHSRWLKVILISLVGFVSACESDNELPVQPQVRAGSGTDASSPVDVSGRVISGFPAGAEVRFLAGSAFSEGIAPEVVTGPGGHFTLAVDSSNLFMPVVVEVKIVAGQTRLTCTSIKGCSSGAKFGEVYVSTESETIYAALPMLRRNEVYNVSRLTDLAYARAALQGVDADVWADPLATVSQQLAFERENSRVASRFNVIGSLSSFATADFTSATEAKASGVDPLYYSALDAAIIEASRRKYPQASAVVAYQQFAESFNRSGMVDRSEMEGVVSYVDVLTEVISMFREYSGEVEAIALLRNELSAARSLALFSDSDQYEVGISSNATGLPSIDKSKLFVENIRQIASSVDLGKIASLSDVSGFVDGKAGEALEAFNLKLDAAQILTGEESAFIRLAATKTAKAVLNSAIDFYFGGSRPTAEGEPLVAISDTGSKVEFRVDQVISVCDTPIDRCAVSVDIVTIFSVDRLTGSSEGALAAKSLNVTFSGSISNERLAMTFAPGQEGLIAENAFLSVDDDVRDEASRFSVYIEAEALSARIRARAERLDLSDQASVDVSIELDSDEIAFEFVEMVSPPMADGIIPERVERSLVLDELGRFDARGGMKILQGDSESFLAGASGSASKPEGVGTVVYRSTEVLECEVDDPESCSLRSESGLEGESEQQFVSLNLATLFKAHLAGVIKPVLIHISSLRESAIANRISGLKVTYPGHALRLNGQFNNNGGITSMNATNLDGMEMFIETGEGGKRYGAVTGPGGEHVADVIDMGQWVKIPYPDGHFVSM